MIDQSGYRCQGCALSDKTVANTKGSTTAYDPTCGSGSLLLKVAAEAGRQITLEGQEKDVTTAGLARMNMILHHFPIKRVAERVRQGGHDIPEPVIRRRFAAGRRNFEQHYRDVVDDWSLYDNAGDAPVLVEWGEQP